MRRKGEDPSFFKNALSGDQWEMILRVSLPAVVSRKSSFE
jgi:hypothetical protein